jgi:hypothetical protein
LLNVENPYREASALPRLRRIMNPTIGRGIPDHSPNQAGPHQGNFHFAFGN